MSYIWERTWEVGGAASPSVLKRRILKADFEISRLSLQGVRHVFHVDHIPENSLGIAIPLYTHHNLGKHLMFVEGFRTNGEDGLSLCVG
jgi:hypothetical protein